MAKNTSGEMAVVYARYSSHTQGEQSIEGQLSEAHRYAKEKGYTIIHEYIDRAQSGRTDNRTEFQKMLRDTAKKKFSVIILWKVDRFGRNREEIALNKLKCKKNGVRTEYVAERIPDSPEGVILESVLEGFAEYYSLQLSQNVRRGQAESAEKGKALGGRPPLGYNTDADKKYIIDPATAPTVKKIFELYANGVGAAAIIEHLNRSGCQTAYHRPFTRSSLHSILKNEKYIGVYIFKDKRIEGAVPRIVDDETFQKVQEMLKVNKRAAGHTWSYSDYILTDKLFCGKCGTAMVGESGFGKSGQKYTYYTCLHKKRDKACDKKAVRQDYIEPLVIEQIAQLIQDDVLIEQIIEDVWAFYCKEKEERPEVTAMKKQLAQTETAMQNLMKAMEAGIFNDMTKARMDELQEQRNGLKAMIADEELSVGFHLEREHLVYSLYSLRELDLTQRKAQKKLIETFVNAIFLYDDGTYKITFNFSGEKNTITLQDLQAAEAGEMFGCCTTCSAITGHQF